MQNRRDSDSVAAPNRGRNRALAWAGVVFAIAFPSIITWGYFVVAARYSTATQQTVYLIVKIIQFGFPVVWTALVLRESLRTSRPTARGLMLGLAFGAGISGLGVVVFNLFLRDLPIFASAAELMQQKVAGFGVDSAAKYFVLAGFYSLVHSLLEEYYWRWFVFRQLERLIPLWPAIIVSAIGFTLHHLVVLAIYFHSAPGLAALFGLAVAIGGCFWAWLYHRDDSIFETWPSHALVDLGLFLGMGYPLLRHAF
jgi:membrane protease YdiL (CAAX protease family)